MSATQPIRGYRNLSDGEIQDINSIKAMGEQLGFLIERLQELNTVDQRWVAIGKTHLQEGMMALTRAIAKPESF
jgi:hypothetical protein